MDVGTVKEIESARAERRWVNAREAREVRREKRGATDDPRNARALSIAATRRKRMRR